MGIIGVGAVSKDMWPQVPAGVEPLWGPKCPQVLDKALPRKPHPHRDP